MKQKYKVFINDQEIVFQSLMVPLAHNVPSIPENYSPKEIYSSIINKQTKADPVVVVPSGDPQASFQNFTDHFLKIEAAGGLVRLNDKNGSLLMIHRLGKWDLPKGKIDPGETIKEAAVREVIEECGIRDLNIIYPLNNTFHMYEHKGQPVLKITHWFLMITKDDSTPVPQKEEGITEAKWVKPEEVFKLLPSSYKSIADLIESVIGHR